MNLIRYGLVFLVVALGVALAVQGLNARVDTVLGSSAQLMVPAMIAALIEGQQFGKLQKRRPNSAEIWGFTWMATLVATLLNLGLAFLAAGIAPEFGKLAIAVPLSQQFNLLLLIYAGGYLICNRFFCGLGAGNQLSIMRSRGEIE
ncbi:MAG: ABZJ_00895 family protein [Roseovarius sp.]